MLITSNHLLAETKYDHLIETASNRYGVDPDLVHAVIRAESNYNYSSVSRAGAVGLMQLMPETARRYGVSSRLDPEQNIDGGVHYLRDLMGMFDNNIPLAVAGYNAGENSVIKYNYSIPPYQETQTYVRRVIGNFNENRKDTNVSQNASNKPNRPASIECVVDAAKKQGVPANVLLALASVSRSKNGEVVKNPDGSQGIGHFQINTSHWAKNGLLYRTGITKQEVAWDGCMNAEVAAWILKTALDEPTSQDYWTKAVKLHSHTSNYNPSYKKDLKSFAKLWGDWLKNKYKAVTVSSR